MDTCVLIPDEFSLVLTLHPNPRNILEMNVALWSNKTLPAGTTFYPDQGSIRLDKLEIYSLLRPDDVRNEYGSEDTISTIEDRDVRHCNWVRFLKASNVIEDINLVGAKVKGEIVFQTVKTILPNEEIVAYLQREDCVDFEHVKVEEILKAKTNKAMTTDIGKVKMEVNVSTVSSILSPMVSCLFTSPPSREDDCKSSVSDASHTSYGSTSSEHSTSTTEAERYSDTECSTHCGMAYPQQTEPVNLSSHRTPSKCNNSADDTTSTIASPISHARSPMTSPTTSCSRSPMTSPLSLSSPTHPTEICVRPKRNRERTWLPCEVCGKKFDRPSLLKRHMRTHTGEKPHACDVCGKAFSTSSSLNTHRRIHSGEKPHECKICGKCFTASSNLYYHKLTHSKDKPHKCSLCSKSFPTPGDLRSHMYVHNGSWPYRCDVCNRGFSKQTNLKNHLLLHTGEKPYECSKCDKKFALYCNLKTHQKVHEDDNQGSCITCGRTFLKKEVTSDHCSDCLRSPSPKKSPSEHRILSDFSISKLTNDDNTSPKQKDILNHRLFSMYNPMMLMAPQSSQFVNADHIPISFLPVFGRVQSTESHVLPHTTGLVPIFHSNLSMAETAYQTYSSMTSLMPQWTGLVAK